VCVWGGGVGLMPLKPEGMLALLVCSHPGACFVTDSSSVCTAVLCRVVFCMPMWCWCLASILSAAAAVAVACRWRTSMAITVAASPT
jgi:hypothetical protein